MAKSKTDELKRLNTNLEQIRSRLVECYHELQIKKQLITPEAIKSKFLGIEEKEYSLMNLEKTAKMTTSRRNKMTTPLPA